MKAICRGTLPCLSTFKAILSMQVSSSILATCQSYLIINLTFLKVNQKQNLIFQLYQRINSKDMFDQKLKEIIQNLYCGRVIVFSNYKIRQTLFSKGITPAIFLHHYYEKYVGQHLIEYNVKERAFKELAEIVPIDIEEYEWFREQKIKTVLRDRVQNNYKLKPSKDITKEDLFNKDLSQNFLRSLNFSWFQDATKYFLYYLTLDQDNYKLSTLQQPLGLTFLIEIDANTNIKSEYDKIKKQSEIRLKKIFTLNPLRSRGIPLLIILLYNTQNKLSYQDAQKQFEALRYDCKLELSLTCIIEINGSEAKDVTHWSNYSRAIFNIQYKLQPSDPIRLIGQNQENTLKTFINNQRVKIKQHIQNRLRQLCKKYEEVNTVKNKFFDIFRSKAATERSYNVQQSQARQIADYLFLLGDYKRATDIYKSLAQKFESNERDQSIHYNICQMIQLSKCLNIFSPNHSNINRSKIYQSIQRYAQKFMIKKAAGISKYKLNRYLIYLLYFFHCFKVFNKDFIKNNFYYFIKKNVNQETVNPNYTNPLIIPALLHQQFANLNLLYPNPQYRRYCYDLVRVASKFSQYKLHYHHLRCILITNKIYSGTFPLIERYINTSLCKTYFQMKNSRETVNSYKNTWNLLLKNYQQKENKSNQQESQFVKFENNYKKIIHDIEKSNPAELERESEECISMPKITNIIIELVDQSIQSGQNSGLTWQEVGDIFLQKPELTSKGMNKQNMVKMLKMFDSLTPEERELAYRVKNLNMGTLNEAILKRNVRTSFINQPILFTFDMKNTLTNPIDFQNVKLHLKNAKKCDIKLKGKNKFQVAPTHSVSIVFEIIPMEAGLYEFSHISWSFSKITSIYKFKQPWQCKSQLKSLYYKLNVVNESGILKVEIKHSHKLYEGQLAQIQFNFTNIGRDEIEQVYLAIENQNIFGFKLKRFQFSLLPGQTKCETLSIKIPLFESNKNHSNYWKCINKSICLYKTGSCFRVLRSVTIFNIYRVAEIYHIICQRISRNLHFLSFSIKYDSPESEQLNNLKSLVIDGGFDIKKYQHNKFGLSIIQYFFFLRLKPTKDLEQFKFTIHGMQCAELIRNNYQVQPIDNRNKTKNQVKLYFLWSDKAGNVGVIDPKPIPITATQNKDLGIKLPFNVKIMVEDQLQYDFQKNVFLELQVEFRIKNIFDPKEINVCIDLTESPNNDFYWQGKTQHMLHLKQNEQSRFVMKLIILRNGVYNIANNIKYIISINKANSHTISHYQYENLYIHIKNENRNEIIQEQNNPAVESTVAQFDFFQNFESLSFKKPQKKQEEQSLI